MSKELTAVLEDIQDTYISKLDPTSNYRSSSNILLSEDYVPLFDIPVSYIPKNSIINYASLTFFVESTTSGQVSGNVKRVSHSDFLTDETTWTNKRNNAPWTVSGGDFDTDHMSSFDSDRYAAKVLASRPLNWWRLSELSGTVCKDSGTVPANGTYVASPTLNNAGAILGSDDKSVLFNGSTQYMTANPTATVTAPFTAEFWFKGTSGTGITATQSPFGTINAADRTFGVWLVNGNTINGRIGDGSNWITTAANGTLSFTDNEWYHIVFVVNPTSYTIYANGANIGSGSLSGSPRLYDSSHRPTIGQHGNGSEYFTGYVDEVALYNKAFTEEEVIEHYEAGIAGSWEIDITNIVKSVVEDGSINCLIGMDKDYGNSNSVVVMSSASNATLSQRPVLNIVYSDKVSLTTNKYKKLSGGWAASNESNVGFSRTANFYEDGNSATSIFQTEDIRIATDIIAPIDNRQVPIQIKGFSGNKTKTRTYLSNHSSGSVPSVLREQGSFYKDKIVYQTRNMRDITKYVVASYKDDTLSDVPVSYWRLNEPATSTKVLDEKYAFDGTATAVTLGSTTIINSYYATTSGSFDGTTSFISVSDSSSYNFDSVKAMSVEAWIYTTSLASKRTIVSKEASGTAKGWSLSVNTTGTLVFERTDGVTTQSATSSTTMSINTAYHVVATFDSSSIKLYINGVEETLTLSGAVVYIPLHTDNLMIGQKQAGTQRYAGRISDLAVYNYVLSTKRIDYKYKIGSIGTATPILYGRETQSTLFNNVMHFSHVSAASIIVPIDLDASSLDLNNSNFIIPLASIATCSYMRLELGNDSKNYWYYELDSTEVVSLTGTNVNSYPMSSFVKIGTPKIGYMNHLKFSFLAGSGTCYIDSFKLESENQESILMSKSLGLYDTVDLLLTGNEITDETRKGDVHGDGLSFPDSSVGVWVSSTNLLTNGSFDSNTTGWSAFNSGTLSRVTGFKKFGLASLRVITPGSVSAEGVRFTGLTVAAGSSYSMSAWIRGDRNASIKLMFIDNAGATYTSYIKLTEVNNWKRITHSFTAAGAGVSGTFHICTGDTSAQAITFYVDGVQFEKRSIPTPYIHTDGATSVRNGGCVQAAVIPAAPSNGWFTAKLRYGWDSTSTEITNPVLMELANDASNYLKLFWSTSDKRWVMKKNVGGTITTVSSGISSHYAGDTAVISALWSATVLKVAVNGTIVTANSSGSTASFTTRVFFLGCDSTESQLKQINSEILWVAAGGVLLQVTDQNIADWAELDDPVATDYPMSISTFLSFIWHANSEKARVIGAGSQIFNTKLDLDYSVGNPKTSY